MEKKMLEETVRSSYENHNINKADEYQNCCILKLARGYTRESKNCFLCGVEKTENAFSDPSSTLNLRSEY